MDEIRTSLKAWTTIVNGLLAFTGESNHSSSSTVFAADSCRVCLRRHIHIHPLVSSHCTKLIELPVWFQSGTTSLQVENEACEEAKVLAIYPPPPPPVFSRLVPTDLAVASALQELLPVLLLAEPGA